MLNLNFLAINNARLSELKRITLRDENNVFPDVDFSFEVVYDLDYWENKLGWDLVLAEDTEGVKFKIPIAETNVLSYL